MSTHIIVEREQMVAAIADAIFAHMKSADVIFAQPAFGGPVGWDWDDNEAIVFLHSLVGIAVARIASIGQEIDLSPGDRLAKMSDVKLVVREMIREELDANNKKKE